MRSDGTGSGPTQKDDTGYVSAREASALLGMSRRAVRTLVSRGRLEVRESGVPSEPEVSLSSVERLRSERRRGR